jgi:hypothetical protein
MRAVAALAIAAAGASACGGTVVFDEPREDDEDGDGESLDCANVVFDARVTVSETCSDGGVCELSGLLADGSVARQRCEVTTTSCRLFVDDVEVCACPPGQIDTSNVCSTGAPTCSAWRIDFSDVDACLEP